MTLKDAVDLIGPLLVGLTEDKFTGKLTLVLDFRDGGIGKMESIAQQELKKKIGVENSLKIFDIPK